MMKKLAVLSLVMVIAGLTNGAFLDLRVDLGSGYVDLGPTLDTTGPVTLGLWRTSTTGFLSGLYYVLVSNSGVISGGQPVIYPGANQDGIIQVNAGTYSPAQDYYPGLAAGLQGLGFYYFNVDDYKEEEDESPEIVPVGLHFKNIIFTGVPGTTANLYLYTSPGVGSAAIWTLRDTVAITTAIPEPMTLGLLGLGALFLRKRA